MSLGKWILVLLSLTIGCIPCVSAQAGEMHLKVVDVIEPTAGEQAKCLRRVGLGLDSAVSKAFDATLVDGLPAGCKLLSPRLGFTVIPALNGRKCTLNITQQRKGTALELRLAFKGVPTLPESGKCCECANDCGRACSVEMSYATNCQWLGKGYGALVCSADHRSIPVGKPTRIKVTVTVSGQSLRDPAVALVVPKRCGGAEIVVVGHSGGVAAAGSTKTVTRYVTRPGIKDAKLILELMVKPGKRGELRISRLAELVGKTARKPRAVPVVSGVSQHSLEYECYVRVAADLVLSVR